MHVGIADWVYWEEGLDPDPDVSFIPALDRRRLRAGARAIFATLAKMRQDPSRSHASAVFASAHGDVDLSLELLAQTRAGEACSPQGFSLSVHNAVAGLWSIRSEFLGSISSVAAGDDSLMAALWEAQAQQAMGLAPVLAVISDRPLPQAYQPYTDVRQVAHCLALSLVPPVANCGWRVESVQDAAGDHNLPQAVLLGRALRSGAPQVLLRGTDGRAWRWSRA